MDASHIVVVKYQQLIAYYMELCLVNATHTGGFNLAVL